MNYKKQLHEMIEKITDKEALKIIRDFVSVPYIKENGEKINGLQENDY